MESFFVCRQTSKLVQVGIIVFDGSNQTCPKYPKQKVGKIFAIYSEKVIEIAVVFYRDAKHSHILWIQSCSLLLVVTCSLLGGCGQKWAQPFRS